jgi:hypothetical protein
MLELVVPFPYEAGAVGTGVAVYVAATVLGYTSDASVPVTTSVTLGRVYVATTVRVLVVGVVMVPLVGQGTNSVAVRVMVCTGMLGPPGGTRGRGIAAGGVMAL